MPLDVNGLPGLPAGRPPVPRDRPGRRRLGVALRRLMVTPTFAAGLGVVVAASLAVNMTKTVLHFSSPVPGGPCAAGNCRPQPAQGGTLASARPGVHIATHRPPATGPGQRRMHSGNAAGDRHPGRSGRWDRPGSAAVITYQLTQQWPGGSWSLSLAYPGARIAGVQGASWEWRSAASGLAGGQNPADGVDQPGDPSGPAGSIQFVVTVDGRSQPPSGCAFDGEPCSFSPAHRPH